MHLLLWQTVVCQAPPTAVLWPGGRGHAAQRAPRLCLGAASWHGVVGAERAGGLHVACPQMLLPLLIAQLGLLAAQP